MPPRRAHHTPFGDRLEALLKAKSHVSRQSLAEKAGVSVATIQSWISGRRRSPRGETLARLAAALDVSTDFLLGAGDESGPLSAAKESLKVYLRTAPLPHETHRLFDVLAESAFAPTSSENWKRFSKEIIEPCLEYALQRHDAIRDLLAQLTAAPAPNPPRSP